MGSPSRKVRWIRPWSPDSTPPPRFTSGLRCGTRRTADDPDKPDPGKTEEEERAERRCALLPAASPGVCRHPGLPPIGFREDRAARDGHRKGQRGGRPPEKGNRGGRKLQGPEGRAPTEGRRDFEASGGAERAGEGLCGVVGPPSR